MPTATVGQQFIVLLYLSAAGMMIGAAFDLTKAWHKVFHFSRALFFIVDLVICLVAALAVFRVLYITNWGEVRIYVFLALLLGIIIYYALCSRLFYLNFLKFFKAVNKLLIKIAKIKTDLQDYLHKKRINC